MGELADLEEPARLKDPYGRNINSLRISITQRCNFNCFFCHKEGEHNPHGELTTEEIEAIVSTAADLGVRKIKITGGEPLLRDDVVEIVRRISPHVDEVSMTTNAYYLADKAIALKEAGLKRVNISLHSASLRTFRMITGMDALVKIRKGITAAVECRLEPVKINMVVLKGVNDGEIQDMIKFSQDVGVTLQLIEYQPLERGAENWRRFHYDLRPLEEELEARSERIVERELHRRRQYYLRGGGVVEVVRPIHNSRFCMFCTRLRMTSDGQLKPCLMRDDNLVEIVSLLRKGKTQDVLVKAFKEAVARREPYWKN